MLVDGVDSLFVQIVLAYGMTRLLPMRRKALFCVVYVLVPTLLNTVGYYLLDTGFFLGLALLALACYVLPFVLYEATAVVRLVALAATALCSVATEALFYACFDLFMGFPLPTGDGFAAAFLVNVPGWLLLEAVRAVVSLILLLLLAWAFRSRRTVKTGRASLGKYLALFAAQAFLLVALFSASLMVSSPAVYAVCAALSLLLLVGDLSLVEVFDRYERKLANDGETERLLAQAREWAEKAAADEKDVEKVARVRHDIRNELSVISALLEKGERDAARAMLDELADRCEIPLFDETETGIKAEADVEAVAEAAVGAR